MDVKVTAKEVYKIFDENADHKDKEHLINMAVKQHGITEATAKMHYTNWKKDYLKEGYKGIVENKYKFKPMMVEGKYAHYSLDKQGVVLVSPGVQLSNEFMKEQQEALELWKEYWKPMGNK